MSHKATEVRYATGEVAQVGDRVINDVWDSVVDDVINTPERMAFWGLNEPGLILKCKDAGLVFEPCSSIAWDAIVCQGRMDGAEGKPLRLDASARSESPGLPAFLSRPGDAPVYYGFTIVEETRIGGWVFGTISDYEDPAGCMWGDAFVVAPDGTRAGIVWQVDSFEPQVVCPPDKDRWGVYGFGFPTAIRTTADFVTMCHSFLPELRRRHGALKAGG